MDTQNISAEHRAIISRTPIQVGGLDEFNELKRYGFQPFIELTFTGGGSHKFWRVETKGGQTLRRWGRIGTYGQEKDFGLNLVSECLYKKIRKGYVVSKPTGSFPVSIWSVRSNDTKLELLDRSNNVVWSDTPRNTLKVLAVCRL